MASPTSINTLVYDVAQRYGVSTTLDTSHLLLRYNSYMEQLFSHGHLTKGAYIKNNTLYVYVRSSVIAQEVTMRKVEILDYLNGLPSMITLDHIITRVRQSLS